jgi:hypothetical protein
LTFQEHFRVHQLLPEFTTGEDRRKMLDALSSMMMARKNERLLTPEQYEIARRAHIEVGVSDETRAKLRVANIGRINGPLSAEHRAKLRAAFLGKKRSAEAIEKSNAGNRGKTLSYQPNIARRSASRT